MGLMDEVKSDATRMGAMLGAIFGFVLLFWMYTISVWLIIVVCLIIIAGYYAFTYRAYL